MNWKNVQTKYDYQQYLNGLWSPIRYTVRFSSILFLIWRTMYLGRYASNIVNSNPHLPCLKSSFLTPGSLIVSFFRMIRNLKSWGPLGPDFQMGALWASWLRTSIPFGGQWEASIQSSWPMRSFRIFCEEDEDGGGIEYYSSCLIIQTKYHMKATSFSGEHFWNKLMDSLYKA